MALDGKAVRAQCYAQLNQTARKGQIVLAGSSLCEQFPVNEMLLNRGVSLTVYNRGISGDVMAGYAQRLQACVFALEPAKLFINIGTNDMNAPDFSPDTHMARYQAMLECITARLPDCRISVLSYYPVNPAVGESVGKGEVYRHRTNALINSMNARLSGLCAQAGYTYINVHDCLTDERGELRAAYTFDGMHLYPAAYARVLDILLPHML